MSNTICVRIDWKYKYCPFRWTEDKQLQIYYKRTWMNAERTKVTNKYGEYVFTIAEG